MKYIPILKIILLGIFLSVSSFIFSKGKPDSLIMNRVFGYRRNFAPNIDGFEDYFYLKYTFKTVRRNPTLFFVPTMYSIAKGNRNYISENIGKITFRSIDNYDIEQTTVKSTVKHNRKVMDIMSRFIIPNIYGVSLFGKDLLSPFNYNNRIYYKYRINFIDSQKSCVTFKPRNKSTQLVSGYAVTDRLTGRIISFHLNGVYDMISFEINANMGDENSPFAIVPKLCESKAIFKFMGNEISARLYADLKSINIYNNGLRKNNMIIDIDSIRPVTLSEFEKDIYKEHFVTTQDTDTIAKIITVRKKKKLKKTIDILDDYVLNGQSIDKQNMSIYSSPLFNPLYLSYSHSRGLSYKMDIGTRYNFTVNSFITLTPRFGYNFKIKQFYFHTPLRFTFNSKKNAWLEFVWANGNRITNSSVLELLQTENRDTVDFSKLDLDYFDDQQVSLSGNFALNKHLEITTGLVYHQRIALNKEKMKELGKPFDYRSFAPFVKLTFTPFKYGPIFTANYERGITGFFKSNIKYERFEFDTSLKKYTHRLRQYNLRVGGGFYTNKSTNYFVDFTNFHENYIPGGWNDDWAGDFQLLNSQWYNASKYYFRTNASYSSPLLLLTWIPIIGKYIETERLYANFLQIEHTRPYTEIGYGLTNRYFSAGIFCSFLNGDFHEVGSKFSFELFSRW